MRPTTDFAKESLFNILINRLDFDDANILDLFAGTGSISFEFASRNARSIKSVDINHKCVDFIKKTAIDLNFANLVCIRADVFQYLNRVIGSFDLIFADPPYDLENTVLIPDLVFRNNLLVDSGILVIEHSRHLNFAEHPNFKEHRKYGNVNFSFFGA